MKKILIVLLLASCSKKQIMHHELWKTEVITSTESGAFCRNLINPDVRIKQLDWSIVNPTRDYIKVGINTKDSLVNGTYYYTYYVELIKSWNE